jgi:hypothetical protein
MAWLKRHLLLAVSGLIALLLLAAGTYYLLNNINRNAAVEAELDQQKHRLEELLSRDPFPHRTNVDAAKREIARVRTVIDQARQSFTRVPYENVTGLEFKKLLDVTIDELQKKASKTSVELPGKGYEFSFAAQKKGLKFSPTIFPRINIQLAEIKTICGILFDSKINRLVNVKRVRLSADDPQGTPDYLENRTETTNDVTGAVLSPYQFEFHCFSSELAAAMEGLYKSPHGLLVKALIVEGVPQQQGPGGGPNPPPPPPPNPANPPKLPPPGQPRPVAPPVAAGRPGAVAAAKDGLETILNEKLLKVILLVEVIKPGAASK